MRVTLRNIFGSSSGMRVTSEHLRKFFVTSGKGGAKQNINVPLPAGTCGWRHARTACRGCGCYWPQAREYTKVTRPSLLLTPRES